jgi:hypothetical protein
MHIRTKWRCLGRNMGWYTNIKWENWNFLFTCYRARIPRLDDARVRPDEILPRRCRLDLKDKRQRSDQAWTLSPSFIKMLRENSESCIIRKWKCHGPWTRHGTRCCSPLWDCNSTACPARLRTRIQHTGKPPSLIYLFFFLCENENKIVGTHQNLHRKVRSSG